MYVDYLAKKILNNKLVKNYNVKMNSKLQFYVNRLIPHLFSVTFPDKILRRLKKYRHCDRLN